MVVPSVQNNWLGGKIVFKTLFFKVFLSNNLLCNFLLKCVLKHDRRGGGEDRVTFCSMITIDPKVVILIDIKTIMYFYPRPV